MRVQADTAPRMNAAATARSAEPAAGEAGIRKKIPGKNPPAHRTLGPESPLTTADSRKNRRAGGGITGRAALRRDRRIPAEKTAAQAYPDLNTAVKYLCETGGGA